jgi:predicted Zn-dependent protease
MTKPLADSRSQQNGRLRATRSTSFATHLHLAACLVAVLAATGCASGGFSAAKSDTATPPSKPLPKELSAEMFDERRDTAMLSAALARWEDGDAATCASLLERLVRRRPDHRAVRHLLADVYAAQGRTAEAEQQLQMLLADNPQDAQAHHSLGLLLDAQDRVPEAVSHLRQATQLEPENPLYALSHETVLAGTNQAGHTSAAGQYAGGPEPASDADLVGRGHLSDDTRP